MTHTHIEPRYQQAVQKIAQGKPLAIAFFVGRRGEYHESFIGYLVRLFRKYNIPLTITRLDSTSLSSMASTLQQQAFSAIFCLDNTLLPDIARARTLSQTTPPLFAIDLAPPTPLEHDTSAPHGVITARIEQFATHFCSIFSFLKNITSVGILYDAHDPLFSTLQTDIELLLQSKNYLVASTPRKPTCTSSDMQLVHSCDVLIFLCRSAPADYVQRLTTICKEQKTILYTTHRIAFAHGAPFTFLPDTAHAAQNACEMLFNYFAHQTIEEMDKTPFQLFINPEEIPHYASLEDNLADITAFLKAITVVHPTATEKVAAYLRLEHTSLE